MTAMPTLFHFTCEHGRAALGPTGDIHPGVNLTRHDDIPWPSHFAWFTDLPDPRPIEVGLTSISLRCNRLAYRYRVTDPTNIQRWLDVAPLIPEADELYHDGARPMRWFVARLPVPVIHAARNSQPRKAARR